MKVLVADDDRNTLKGLSELLSHEGFHVLQAIDGEQAWYKFEEHRPDFLCLDVMMPRLNGYELCKKIRKVDSQVPIIFLTAKGEEIDKVVGLELGADDYVVKPFASKELLARIRAVTRRCIASRQLENGDWRDNDPFVMCDLKIFPAELRAVRGGEEIDLSLRDVKILQLLFRKKSQVVDRDQLMQHAWGQDYMASSRSLDQHISQLRKRIEIDPKNPCIIETVHGVGYRYQK